MSNVFWVGLICLAPLTIVLAVTITRWAARHPKELVDRARDILMPVMCFMGAIGFVLILIGAIESSTPPCEKEFSPRPASCPQK